jgi:MATE family multidrug resistance protein
LTGQLLLSLQKITQISQSIAMMTLVNIHDIWAMTATDTNQKNPHRTIIAIAFPAILANSSAPLVGLVDTWAIGHLPDPAYLAAIGLGSVIFNFLLWAFGFLRMGTTGIIAQAHGKNDTQLLVSGIWRSVVLALGLGLILLMLQDAILVLAIKALAPPDAVANITAEYFHIRIWATPAALLIYAISGVLFGLARTRAVLVQQLVLNMTNAVLNVIFVVGLGWGVAGVAWGTLIAQWFAAVIGVWLLIRIIGLSPLIAGMKSTQTWLLSGFKELIAINGFIFVRTILLMTALSLIMRIAGGIGEIEMAASHVLMQYVLLISLGLDGFAHATEALAGAAWGKRNSADFHRWVKLTGVWAMAASFVYAFGFYMGGSAITGLLTDIVEVRLSVEALMPIVVVLPIVAFACYQFDGVFIAATAGAAMMVTMAIAFTLYLLVLTPMTERWELQGLWMAVLIFMAARGLTQAIYYPWLRAKLKLQ